MPDKEKPKAPDPELMRTLLGGAVDVAKRLGKNHVELTFAEAHDLLALLEDQRPRVMTLDEVEEEGVYWLEVIQGLHVGPAMVCRATEDRFLIRKSEQTPYVFWKYQYGMFYRLWTNKPTSEQRKAVPWGSCADACQIEGGDG